MDHSTLEHASHGMGPAWLGGLYLLAVLLAVATHIFNMMRPAKLARLSEADKDARANRMERNMLYVCAGHIPMGLAWLGWIPIEWGLLVGLCMVASEGWLAYRSYQRAKQVYSL